MIKNALREVFGDASSFYRHANPIAQQCLIAAVLLAISGFFPWSGLVDFANFFFLKMMDMEDFVLMAAGFAVLAFAVKKGKGDGSLVTLRKVLVYGGLALALYAGWQIYAFGHDFISALATECYKIQLFGGEESAVCKDLRAGKSIPYMPALGGLLRIAAAGILMRTGQKILTATA